MWAGFGGFAEAVRLQLGQDPEILNPIALPLNLRRGS